MATAVSIDERVKMAAGFLVDAPPGEFHEVLNDVRILVNDDAKLQMGIKAAVHEYNLTQFMTCKLDGAAAAANGDGAQHVLVSKHGELDDENTFYDPRSMTKFKFDHIRQIASKAEPYEAPAKTEGGGGKWRAALDAAVQKYVADHYAGGVSAVYAKDGTLTIVLVNNKYNPANFWNGRWRSEWQVKVADGTGVAGALTGLLRVNVHYYEDGNVQLNTDKEITTTLQANADPAATAEDIVQFIKNAEHEYQLALNESYVQLADNTFKGLRRVLPVTRNKLDWNKILNYKLGAALTQ